MRVARGASLFLGLALLMVSLCRAQDHSYVYDNAGHVVLVNYGNGTATAYTYDRAGNLLSQESRTATLAFSLPSLTLSAGGSGTLTITLSFAQGSSTVVTLTSSPAGVVTVPPSVTIPAGATSTDVTLTAVSIGTATIMATLPAVLGARTATAGVIVDAPPSPEVSYAFVNRGGVSRTSTGTGSLGVGYARIVPNSGSTTPAGLAIFGFRQNGILVTEAGVPASPLIRSGRIYAEVDGAVNTGLAVANPNGQPANMSFFFTDGGGTNFGAGNTVVPANGQIAAFLNQAPFNGGNSIRGTFTFNSNVPVGVIALRGLSNERSEFLITTLPVADLSLAASTAAAIFPHFADGGGWTTQIVMVNTSDEVQTGTVQFIGQGTVSAPAQPVTVTVDGTTASSFNYSIPPRSSRVLRTSGPAGPTRAGSVRITPSSGSRAPSGLGIFSFKTAGVTVTEAGVPVSPPAVALRMYAEVSGPGGGSIQTGVAVANTSADALNVNFELTKLDGSPTGLSGAATVPGNGQIALFLNQISGFGTLPTPFQGVLRIASTTTAGISVVGLRGRSNERNDFLITTSPPVNENTPASTAELVFPHFADGGGYTTQFILFSGSAGQSADGRLRFFTQSGQPFGLRLK